ncbi:hypothetical protein BDY17DRAFT_327234 [Neohortaea acidophila]|uniref:Uncharacterized protein n=1 Tax=Neohortaea acidophila TaxID=245834 RepID=A0A6A6PJT9_9PEZI|nr:uncharacterized protein BDY17DRAFT_327234 [Neohortaea acidophila]KAF2480269.1 hypothetical protein BDY17DRAFT_327234 [Neohortaea acidophila]
MEAPTRTNRYLEWQENHDLTKIRLHEQAKAFGSTKAIEDWKTIEGLRYWVQRRELKLLDYEACSDAELSAFIVQRKLAICPDAMQEPYSEGKPWALRACAIEALGAADRAPMFHHFLDLVPELRQRIYEIDMQDFKASSLPAKPPIASTCRLIRQEALPLLYVNHTVILSYDMKQLSKVSWILATDGVVIAPGQTKPPGMTFTEIKNELEQETTWGSIFARASIENYRTTQLLFHMPPEHFQYLRQIHLVFNRERFSAWHKAAAISVTLGKSAQTYRVKVERLDTDLRINRKLVVQPENMVERRVIEVLDQVATRGGMMKLTAEDFCALKHAITRGWCDYSEWHKETTGEFAY